jgi:hypothetical protein
MSFEIYLALHDVDQHRYRNSQTLGRSEGQRDFIWNVEGKTSAISFRVQTEFGLLTFRLPARIAEVHQVLRSKAIPPRLRTREQAERVAWRIVKDWLEAQLALIQAGLATVGQVFLPFCQDPAGVTLYERMRKAKFSGVLLEKGNT